MADIKFCGLTRSEDAQEAVHLGARYLGVIFAGGPRTIDVLRARAVLESAPGDVKRVGVFGAASAETIGHLARQAAVDIVQLHADPTPETVRAVRSHFAGPVWAVVRISGDAVPPGVQGLFAEADAVVLDARADTSLGGTGIALPWAKLLPRLEPLRAGVRIVLAGGLNATNVAEAIDALSPDIVDVSSGVESAPGVKDPALMSAFAKAARSPTRAA